MLNYNILTQSQYLREETGIFIDKENKEIIVQTKSEFGDVETVYLSLSELKELVVELEK